MNFSPPRPVAPGRPKDPEKRAAILDAAMRLFPARGYDGVSMDAIAQQAGVSKLTVYSHFDDKESLFAAAVTTCCEELLPHGVFEPAGDQSVRAALTAIAQGFTELIMDERAIKLHQIMIAQAGQKPRLTEIFFGAGPRRTLDEMETFLRQAAAAGALDVPNPAHAAAHFFCLLKGIRHMSVLVGMCPLPTLEERREHIEEVVDIFLRAFSAKACIEDAR
ncbi:MAG TPA: TetR/AcrR family transcriptional regulator [Arenimonas sp.]|uniref:TetR/AcrR family transcriptional regulator n=1 Tax=Arenimonas sp. TaxID=1872635 RepID=UPI002BF0FF69|nr:TetR/AcrR family transcriptional regulator [Arenimonas sp.]HMB56036.1 TetR/AcrR family transcriptional regulator [Arenimonas sp.]